MYKEINSFETACEKLQINTVLPNVSMLRAENQKTVVSNYKLDIIQEAINQILDFNVDWTDSTQYKYYPWFSWSSSVLGFAFNGYRCDHSDASVGSRRVFPNREVARYFAQQFIELHNDALTMHTKSKS
jgi:hypothetical protein